MLLDPLGSSDTVSVAISLLTFTGDPRDVVPSKNCTVPVGDATPRLANTSASRRTDEFGSAPVGVKTAVVVAPLFTVTLTGAEELAMKLGSPEYVALS